MSKDTQQQKKLKVLLIGELCVDYFHYGTIDRISPEAPVPVLKITRTEQFEGMAGNVKKNLEGLGVECFIIHNFEAIIKSRYVDERFNQHVVRVDNEVNIKPIKFTYFPDDFFKPDAIVISDYNKGFITSCIASQLIKHLKNRYPECEVFVDTKKSDVSCYENCVLKLNEKEYEKCKNTLNKSNKTIVTLGKNGAMYKEKIYPSREVEMFDVSGAGDTFLAGLVYKYLECKNFEESIIFANKCASFAVTKKGTYSIKAGDLNDLRF